MPCFEEANIYFCFAKIKHFRKNLLCLNFMHCLGLHNALIRLFDIRDMQRFLVVNLIQKDLVVSFLHSISKNSGQTKFLFYKMREIKRKIFLSKNKKYF